MALRMHRVTGSHWARLAGRRGPADRVVGLQAGPVEAQAGTPAPDRRAPERLHAEHARIQATVDALVARPAART